MKNFTDNIPAPILEWANQLQDPKLSRTAKHNYITNLTNVRDFCSIAIANTRPEQHKHKKVSYKVNYSHNVG